VAKQGDGWLSREMGGSVGSALACYSMAAFCIRIQTSLKIYETNGLHKQRSGLHTLARQKIFKKRYRKSNGNGNGLRTGDDDKDGGVKVVVGQKVQVGLRLDLNVRSHADQQ
jgi:hypothetical protein